jgi:hypothetical protein
MRMSVKSSLLAVTLIVCVGLIAGAAQATYPSTYLLSGYTVTVGSNSTFYTDLSNIDWGNFHFGNPGSGGISGNATHYGSATLLFTADPGKWFTEVSVGTYGGLFCSAAGGYAWAWNSLSLTGGASYGPVTPDTWYNPYGVARDYGNRDGHQWDNIPVNASSFTVNFWEGLESSGTGAGWAGPSAVVPGYLFFGAALTNAPPPPVPIPSALFLFGSGLAGLVGWRRFRKE